MKTKIIPSALVLSLMLAGCSGGGGNPSDSAAPTMTLASTVTSAPNPSITADLGKPTRLLVGLGKTISIADMQAQQIAPDIIDTYLVAVTGFNSGGGNGWPQWQWNTPDGGYVTKFSDDAAAMGAVPMYTLFQMPSMRGGDVTVMNDAQFMAAYWAQVKLMYQKIGETGRPALVNLEPDFWGFAQGSAPDGDPAKLPARVSTVPECANQPNTAVGVVGCLVTLGRWYAPKARIGFPPSLWSGDANATGTFMAKLGADKADFIVAQTSDRDAGCFEDPNPVDACKNRGNGPFYKDEAMFKQGIEQWNTVRSHLGGLPILYWQTPMGVPSSTPGGTPKHYRDNHVQYMLTHTKQYADNGTFAIVFSGGDATSADITTDGGQFARLFKEYLANPPYRNLLSNPGFENGLSGWGVWPAGPSYTETWGMNSGASHLTHWGKNPYYVTTYQGLTGLSNGLYTAKAWVKGGGGQRQMYVKNFGAGQMTIDLPGSNTYTQVVISDINVTNGNAEIGFFSKDPSGNSSLLYVDDVTFYKQ